MKKRISRIICTLLCCAPIAISAQTSEKITSPVNLYKEGKELFQEKNYAAAIPALKAFVKQKPTASLLQDAEYMLVSSAYELKDKNRIELLRKYLDRYLVRNVTCQQSQICKGLQLLSRLYPLHSEAL